jgi:hypothetical protein
VSFDRRIPDMTVQPPLQDPILTRFRAALDESTARASSRRMMRDEPRVNAELRAFLGRTQNLKAIADYETGAGSHV